MAAEQRKFGKDDGEKEATMGEWMYSKVKESIVESIPIESVKNLPVTYTVMFGLLVTGLQLVAFLYFTVSGYQTSQKSEFMSLDQNAGRCEQMPSSGKILSRLIYLSL